jgi:hypothetical protein
MAGDVQLEMGPSAAGNRIGAAFSRRLRQTWASDKGRRAIICLMVLLVVLILVGLGAQMVSSISSQTTSYKDGYSAGGNAYSLYGSVGEGAQQACEKTALKGARFGGRPAGDNASQWLKGCVDSFNTIQSDN